MSTWKKLMAGGPSDPIPDAFTVTDLSGLELSTQYSQNVTPVGYDIPTTWSVSVGDARTTSNATYSTSGTLLPGETLTCRATQSASFSTAVNVTVTIGGVTDTWTLTTRAQDVTPNAFTFTDVTSANLSTQYTATVTPSGFENSVSWQITGGNGSGMGSVAGGGYATSGTISLGQSLTVRANSSAQQVTTDTYTVNIGSISDSWSITTILSPGEVYYTSPGTYNWTVPANVTSVCAAVTPGQTGQHAQQFSTLTATSGFGHSYTTRTPTFHAGQGAQVIYKFGYYFFPKNHSQVYRSTDGDTWTQETIGGSWEFASILAETTNAILSIGFNYEGGVVSVYKTTNGITWTNVGNTMGTNMAMSQPNGFKLGNRTCVFTGDARIYYTDDDGSTWNTVWNPFATYIPSCYLVDGQNLLVYRYDNNNGNTSAVSSDGGQTWTKYSTGLGHAPFSIAKLNSGVYVGVRANGPQERYVYVSPANNPHSFTAYNADSRFSVQGLNPVFIGQTGTHVIVQVRDQSSYPLDYVYISTDGVNWEQKKIANTLAGRNFNYINGKYIMQNSQQAQENLILRTNSIQYSGADGIYTSGNGRFNLQPNVTINGTYGSDIVAWKNNMSTTPGSTMQINVGQTNGAVRIIWGSGRSFPNNGA